MVFNEQILSPRNDTCPDRTIKKSRIGETQTEWGLNILFKWTWLNEV